jgi:ABC-type ATPase with predicted acetyltransferase domain
MSQWLVDSYVFKHPFTCLIVGPSGCGKTELLIEILRHQNILFNNELEKIIFCYKEYQPSYDKLKSIIPNIIFHQGVYDNEFNKKIKNLVIFDDLMKETLDNSSIQDLFTIESHHKNTSVILISHNLFVKSKFARTINLNTNYLILFNNPRDKSQINVLSRQMYPNNTNFLIKVFNDAVASKQHGYLFIDFRLDTIEKNRIFTNIIPNEPRIIYTA